jgi:hypothetical protein
MPGAPFLWWYVCDGGVEKSPAHDKGQRLPVDKSDNTFTLAVTTLN